MEYPEDLYPHAKCPYCEFYQKLDYKNALPLDDVYFVEKLEEPIITDSFSEVTTEAKCKNCGKTFHFVKNLAESIASRMGTKYEHLDKTE